jgi:hypothetical protein
VELAELYFHLLLAKGVDKAKGIAQKIAWLWRVQLLLNTQKLLLVFASFAAKNTLTKAGNTKSFAQVNAVMKSVSCIGRGAVIGKGVGIMVSTTMAL